MYTLFYSPDACSLATQVVLRELDQPFHLVHKDRADDFAALNPVGAVPVLKTEESVLTEGTVLTEGAAILLYLLGRHDNDLMPSAPKARAASIENMMFANATMHPAYGRLFFILQNIGEGPEQEKAFQAAAHAINYLWDAVETKLADQPYLGGEQPSAADILLTVYSRWGDYFPVDIQLGQQTQQMISAIKARASFRASLAAEAEGLTA